METSFLTLQQAALAPVVIGVVAAIRMGFSVQDRYMPLISMAIGIGAAFVFPAITVGLTVIAGVVIGLMASGLYSGGKTLVQG